MEQNSFQLRNKEHKDEESKDRILLWCRWHIIRMRRFIPGRNLLSVWCIGQFYLSLSGRGKMYWAIWLVESIIRGVTFLVCLDYVIFFYHRGDGVLELCILQPNLWGVFIHFQWKFSHVPFTFNMLFKITTVLCVHKSWKIVRKFIKPPKNKK